MGDRKWGWKRETGKHIMGNKARVIRACKAREGFVDKQLLLDM